MTERSEITNNRGAMTDMEQFEAGEARFRKIRELGQRGVYMVKWPTSSECMDVVDFDIEVERRKAAGLIPGVNFWTAELPEEVDK